MKFEELIPAEDRLGEELASIKGGLSGGATCFSGIICDVGKTEDDPIEVPDEEPIEDPIEDPIKPFFT